MSSKELEERLECMKRDMAAIEAEIKANKEFKPYDWAKVDRYHVNHAGSTGKRLGPSQNAPALFYTSTSGEAKRFAHKLKILSCINNLKKTLGCDWEFTKGLYNYNVYTNRYNNWDIGASTLYDKGQITFKNKEDAEKVAKYLNTHYPNGWSLPDSTSESD